MTFSILLVGILVFIVCLAFHVIIWRTRYPKNRPFVLLLIFIVLPLVFIVGYMGLGKFGFLSADTITAIEWLTIYLLHFALSSAYILSYPAIEAVSPSLAIVLMIGGSNPHGMAHKDLLPLFDDETVLEPRIRDLMEAGLIIASDGFFTVTPRGMAFVKCFILLRRVLGLPIGKG